MRDDGTDRTGWASTPAGHLTPADVQQKQFRTARMGGGYRMREVDEFLDQVTDTITSLIAENERLRREGPRDRSADPMPAAPMTEGDRAAIESFLRREKAFLQDLGGLVQGHAEELKGMVRSTRRTAAPAKVEEPRTQAEVLPAVVPAEEPEAVVPAEEPEAVVPQPVEASTVTPPVTAPDPSTAPAAAEGASTSGTPMEDPDDASSPSPQDETVGEASDDARGTDEGETGTLPTVEAEQEEPIRIDEPEPARSRRTEERSSDSLRELFWGEE